MNMADPAVSSTTCSDEGTGDDNAELELRVAFQNGRLFFMRASADTKFDDLRVFTYDKLKAYSHLITNTHESMGEDAPTEIPLHHTKTQENPHWTMLCWWQVSMKAGNRPLLDEPFRELLDLLEKAHDDPDFDPSVLPQIPGVTTEVPIFKIARLHWSAKHLRLNKPLQWENALRAKLLRAINAIDCNDEVPAFRSVDFWYIWGAYRGLDEEIVDAMVSKMIDAIDHKTAPQDLSKVLIEGRELEDRMAKLRERRRPKTWAEQLGGGIGGRRTHLPSKLSITTNTTPAWREAPKTADATVAPISASKTLKSEDMSEGPKTSTATSAPVTILRRDSAASAVEKKSADKGSAFTEPTGMAPPPPSSVLNGRDYDGKKKASWGHGSKRGKGGKGRGGRGRGEGGGGGGAGWGGDASGGGDGGSGTGWGGKASGAGNGSDSWGW